MNFTSYFITEKRINITDSSGNPLSRLIYKGGKYDSKFQEPFFVIDKTKKKRRILKLGKPRTITYQRMLKKGVRIISIGLKKNERWKPMQLVKYVLVHEDRIPPNTKVLKNIPLDHKVIKYPSGELQLIGPNAGPYERGPLLRPKD